MANKKRNSKGSQSSTSRNSSDSKNFAQSEKVVNLNPSEEGTATAAAAISAPPLNTRQSVGTQVRDAMAQHAPNVEHDHPLSPEQQKAEAELAAAKEKKEAERLAREKADAQLAKQKADAEAKEIAAKEAELRAAEGRALEEAELKKKEVAELERKEKEAFKAAAQKEREAADIRAKEEAVEKKAKEEAAAEKAKLTESEKNNAEMAAVAGAGAMAAMAAAGAAVASTVVKKGKGEALEEEDIERLERRSSGSAKIKPENKVAANGEAGTATDPTPGVAAGAALDEEGSQDQAEFSSAEELDTFSDEKPLTSFSGMEGYLYKPGRFQKNRWVTRYYILEEDGRLLYKVNRYEEEVLGQFKMNQNVKIVDEKLQTSGDNNYGHAFMLNFGGRDRTFSADTAANRTKWIEALTRFQ